MEKGTKLLEGSIWKGVVAFAIPLFLGNLFQQLYNTVDSLIVGNFLGSDALAAVSSSGSLIFLLVGFFNGIAVGAGVVISKYFGARDYENLKYNTAIAAMMALLNDFTKKGSITKGEYKTLLILLNPVAPHITEELWQIIGGSGYVYEQTWPEYEEAKTVENTVEIAVQINGKTKGTLAIGRDDAKEDVIAKAKESIADKLTGNIVKEIYVPGRIVNIVMK